MTNCTRFTARIDNTLIMKYGQIAAARFSPSQNFATALVASHSITERRQTKMLAAPSPLTRKLLHTNPFFPFSFSHKIVLPCFIYFTSCWFRFEKKNANICILKKLANM